MTNTVELKRIASIQIGPLSVLRVPQILLLLAGWFIASSTAIGQDEDAVWRALKTPGAVVVLRHSYAPGSFDPPDSKIDDCSTQRMLDTDGRAQARAIGEAFLRHNIVVGDVLSSPKCRTRDTGLLAFGRVESWSALLGARTNTSLGQERLDKIHHRMQQHSGDKPLTLITHGRTARALTGRFIEMGELVVMLPATDDRKFYPAAAIFIQPQ